MKREHILCHKFQLMSYILVIIDIDYGEILVTEKVKSQK